MSNPRTRKLRPVPDSAPRLAFRTVHGYRRAYRIAGEGPVLLLIHGIGDNSETWNDVIPHLAQNYTVIAPDLLGHGQSDKPRADYSVAAYANGMRDLLSVLGIEHVTVVGHSLGGGVAMQFSYQFPHMVDRLVLVASGGVTKDVHPILRIASLPLVSEAVKLLRIPGALSLVKLAGSVVGRVNGSPLRPGGLLHDTPDLVRVLSGLPDPTASEAYLRTLRAVVDWRGQVVTMLDRCYLTESLPVLLVWGDEDSVIPISHARLAHAAMPGSKLEVFRRSGHFPFRDDPIRFLRVLEAFFDETTTLEFDEARWRHLLATGVGEDMISGSASTRLAVLGAMGSDERSAT
ncbi:MULTISPECIES: alpha/beta fold hydrolase [Nocardiaceae]|jgi:pimeloyl-ACP methyl ester carboxylesterase|uniref:alpha/beta fold hydrolase n=1 Tax=Nocardiaceae TaxID=85025 RepID=UPI0005639BEB|nr:MULTISPECIES: alpha/beta hydrolase [Rhodococcus]OZE94882.1 alpha/beta hydrolase [Rhodococcus sp. 15-1189-1-1a]OZF09759.1 alpha/beta hydrolase [Rhodococcus sp. 14-2686-1-2]OZF43006.1 alpha/beta hydrolase [Rhodococcus sp. 14-2470-1b]